MLAIVEEGVRRVVPAMRAVFVIGSFLVAAAGFQLFVLSDHTDRFFAWPIEPGVAQGTDPRTPQNRTRITGLLSAVAGWRRAPGRRAAEERFHEKLVHDVGWNSR